MTFTRFFLQQYTHTQQLCAVAYEAFAAKDIHGRRWKFTKRVLPLLSLSLLFFKEVYTLRIAMFSLREVHYIYSGWGISGLLTQMEQNMTPRTCAKCMRYPFNKRFFI